MNINVNTTLQQNPNIIASEIDGETVMMDINFEKYFGLQAVGTRVWQLLAQPMLVGTLCSTLTEEFDVSFEQCQQDITPFISDLLKQEMLVES